jgi:hypothetical protein
MTANIQQYVVSRRTNTRIATQRQFRWQRGSASPQTYTVVFGLLLFTLISCLGFFYLQQVLNTASQGSSIEALEEKLLELKSQQRNLELEGAQLRSIETIEERVKELNLVEAQEVVYLGQGRDLVAAATIQ